MSLPPLASTDALKLWPGVRVAAEQEASAAAVLDAASALVRRRARQTWLNVDGSALGDVPDGVPQVVVACAARFWCNPTNLAMLTAGAESEQWSQTVKAGLTLTDDELQTIAGTSSRPPFAVLSTTRDECIETGGCDWYGGAVPGRLP